MIRTGNLNQILSLAKDTDWEFIIVGYGIEGKFICDKLQSAGYRIKCFADENQILIGKDYSGIRVLHPQTIKIDSKDILIICIGNFTKLSDSEIMEKSIVKNLDMKDSDLYLWDKFQYCRDLFINLCHKNNIGLDGKVIKIGDLTLPNYLLMDKSLADSFMQEARDLILPEYFNEWSAINEGPYNLTIPGGGGIPQSSISGQTSVCTLQSPHQRAA